MKYSVLIGQTVGVYATVYVEAATPEEAEQLALKSTTAGWEVDWDGADDLRVVAPAEEEELQ